MIEPNDHTIRFMVEFSIRCGICGEYMTSSDIHDVHMNFSVKPQLIVEFSCPDCGKQSVDIVVPDEVQDMTIPAKNALEELRRVDQLPRSDLGKITPEEIDRAMDAFKNTNMNALLKSLGDGLR
jgi:C4-type Zn-finger protein